MKVVATTLVVLHVSGCLLSSKYERPDWSLEYSAILSYASAFHGETEAVFHSEVINTLNIYNIDYMVHCRAMTTISARKDQEKKAILLLTPIINKYVGRVTIKTVGHESSCGTNQMRNARGPTRIVAEMNGSSFLFETNGSYAVHLEYSSMGTILRKRIDSGTWQSIETNRLVMVSNKLLFSPKLKYDSFAIEISTRESLDVWIEISDAILRRSTNVVFAVDDFREVCREKIASLPYESVEEETGEGSVFVLKNSMPRRDFEKFRSDLVRLKRVPEWWTVSCEWVEEGGKVRLIPEKSKEADF